MNIGLLIPPSEYGGVFNNALGIAEALINFPSKHTYTILHSSSEDISSFSFSPDKRIEMIQVKIPSSLLESILLYCNLMTGKRLYAPYRTSFSLKYPVDLLLVPFPSLFGFKMNIPYIVHMPDMMFKYYPRFPEFTFTEKLMRTILYKHAAEKAVLSIVDSQQGLKDLNHFFKIPENKIRIIPFIPPGYIFQYRHMAIETAENILSKYHLPDKYLFYPAQFWFHKNHIRLIQAVKFARDKYGISPCLVLVGYPKETYQKVMDTIKELQMTDFIIHLGYVSGKEMVALYKKAAALVYPSLFGPTNIPPAEAMILGTPVVCSNLFSMPDMIGDSGLLFDPFRVDDIAQKIFQVWTDDALRNKLVQKGFKRARAITLENYSTRWHKIIEEALNIIKKTD